MEFLLAVVAVVIVGAIVGAAAGRGAGLAKAPRDGRWSGLPEDRDLAPDDVTALRFDLAVRGYRMGQVDEALDRLSEQLRSRDERIAQLEAHLASSSTDPMPQPVAAPTPSAAMPEESSSAAHEAAIDER